MYDPSRCLLLIDSIFLKRVTCEHDNNITGRQQLLHIMSHRVKRRVHIMSHESIDISTWKDQHGNNLAHECTNFGTSRHVMGITFCNMSRKLSWQPIHQYFVGTRFLVLPTYRYSISLTKMSYFHHKLQENLWPIVVLNIFFVFYITPNYCCGSRRPTRICSNSRMKNI